MQKFDAGTVFSSVMWFEVMNLPVPWVVCDIPEPAWLLVTKAEFEGMWSV